MDDPKEEPRPYAAVGLWGLAAAALTLSLLSTTWRAVERPRRVAAQTATSPEPWPLRRPARRSGVAAVSSPRIEPPSLVEMRGVALADAAADFEALLAKTLPTRPTPLAAAPAPLRAPSTVEQPVAQRLPAWVARAEADRSAPIVVLTPAAPLWDATAARRVDGYRKLASELSAGANKAAAVARDLDPRRWPRGAGRWLSGVNLRASRAPGWSVVAEAIAPAPRLLHSPPTLAGPLLFSPGDRLAMAPVRNRRVVLSAPAPPAPEPLVTPNPGSNGPFPAVLLDVLHTLLDEEEVAAWALRAEKAVRDAAAKSAAGGQEAVQEENEAASARPGDPTALMDEVSRAGMRLADQLGEAGLATRVRRACYAIDRRAEAWRIAAAMRAWDSRPGVPAPVRLAMKPTAGAPAWRHYLNTGGRGQSLPPPGGPAGLLSGIEAYEQTRSPLLAQLIAQDARRLGDSSTDLHRRLADEIEQKYRNANLRVAVADALLERFLPAAPTQTDPVRQTIAGAFVRGRATTRSQLSLRMLPDPFQWRVGLEARGDVRSATYANPGPVVIQNRTTTTFHGRKLITIDRDGIHAAPAVCDSRSSTRLTGLSSYYDNVPLLGAVVRSRANDQVASRRGLARRQAEQQVNRRVRQALDDGVPPQLQRLEDRYAESVVGRAAALGLKVEPMELRTTDSRLIARLRVASDRQLAAHTPRNRAPSDSVASLQLHESLLNNLVDGLALGGRRFSADGLQAYVRQRLRLPAPAAAGESVEAPRESAELVFEEAEPIRVLLGDGRAELILAVREMAFERTRFRAFKVHAFFAPEADGIQARLARVGGLQIEGRMRTAKRIRLHGIFSQVLSADRPLPLLRLPPEGEPRLDGLMVTQLVIDDGWLGLAIGPDSAGPAPSLKRVATVGSYVR